MPSHFHVSFGVGSLFGFKFTFGNQVGCDSICGDNAELILARVRVTDM